MTNHESSDEENIYSDEEGGVRVEGIYIPPPIKPYCNLEVKGPRLVITNIENRFFKSYADKQVLGPFHKCFNAIVGPNGSGKSNVIDSMLFVFGYRANKIRSKKLSVLIHNSSTFPSVQSCTVSVCFGLIEDNEEDSGAIIPGSEFVVSRTAFKDNSSYYELNRKKVQFKEIAVLLRQKGIDLDHNRFLILQGEVEQISMMKPKATNEHETGMLEYLEDIIGTTRFKKPLGQLEERVELLTEQKSDKLNRLKLIEDQIEELKKPMEEAVQFLTLENSISKSNNILIQHKLYDLKKSANQKEDSGAEYKEALTKIVEQLKTIQNELTENEKLSKEVSNKYNELLKYVETSNKALDKANSKDIQLKDEMIEINKNRKKNMEILEAEKTKLEKNEKIPQKNEEMVAQVKEKLAKFSENLVKFQEQKASIQESLKDETKDLQKKREKIESELNNLKRGVHSTEAAYKIATSELNLHTENEVNEKETLKTLEIDLSETDAIIKERVTEMKSLNSKIPLTKQSLKNAQEELLTIKLQEAKLIEKINRERMQVEEAKSSFNASKSKSKILDTLMQQKREGNCPGLFGRLGDLGAIDIKYDVAVSTACGPLDHLVTDTVETAKWCLEFLKHNNIGRTSIIALEKQTHLWQHINKPINTPENVPRLFDLIRVENEELRPAFYYGLRDTLVATNLDQAERVAYGRQRYRVVTLGGDLIEMSGTMSGGGNRVSKGRMGQSIVTSQIQPQDIDVMEHKVQQMESQLREHHSKQSSLENQIHTLDTELNKMQINFQKYTMEEKALKQQLIVLKSKVDKQILLVKSIKSDPNILKKLTNNVQVKKNEFDTALANTSELQTKVDKITNEIKEKTDGKLKTIKDKIKETTTAINKAEKDITSLEVAISTSKRNVNKSQTTIRRLEDEIKNQESSLRSKQEERVEIANDATTLQQCIDNVSDELKTIKGTNNEHKEKVTALKKKQNEIKSEKIEIDNKLKSINEKINEIKAHLHKWNVKLHQLKLHQIPDHPQENLDTISEEDIANIDVENIQRDLHVYEENLKRLKPNLSIIDEYRKKRQFYVEKANEVQEIVNRRTKMKELFDGLKTRRKEEFLTGYNIIKMKLKEMYQMITLGGDADFELVDTFDPFSEGILLNVRPPKKTWKIISNLSGGEKTLTSLALVFALHYYKPSPLYVMDEIDAALDFKNVSIVANYIKDRTKNAQFIIISLRNYMFELCDHLVGIYKTDNTTKSITINPQLIENMADADKENENFDNLRNV